MTSYKSLRGRVTVVLTPELRQLAFNHIYAEAKAYGRDADDLLAWFQSDETPDLHVLDASACEAEALMIKVIVSAIAAMYAEPEESSTSQVDPDQDWDRDAEIRILTRSGAPHPDVRR